jgi:hypothetical protein
LLARYLTRIVTLGMLAAGSLAAQPRLRAHEASVGMVVSAGNGASVQARYAFTGNPGAMSFEYLEQPCARVGVVRLESEGRAVPYARVATGPWVRLHDTSAVDPLRTSLGYKLTYDVALHGNVVSIPVIVPVTALATAARRGDPVATVAVRLPQDGRVVLPRMARVDANGRWAARMIALPSAVRVRLATPNGGCSADASTPGESGRFILIFWSLIATLVLWVPLYLWWANRQRDAA